MYKQTTITPEGQTRTRTVDDQKIIELLTQMHILKQSGEDIEVHTNASMENKWNWNKITAIRKMGNRGFVTTIFDKV
jgi:hypothetical protein